MHEAIDKKDITSDPERVVRCRSLVSEADWISAWAALRTLRPKLTQADCIGRKPQLQLDGYNLVGLFEGNQVVSVARYTISPHPVFIREMIIHDMATLTGEQGKGYGSELLDFLDSLALKYGCGRTFVATAKASVFYERNGYTAYATAFKKVHA